MELSRTPVSEPAGAASAAATVTASSVASATAAASPAVTAPSAPSATGAASPAVTAPPALVLVPPENPPEPATVSAVTVTAPKDATSQIVRCECAVCGAHSNAVRGIRVAGSCPNCGSLDLTPIDGALPMGSAA